MSTETTNKKIKIDNGTTFGRTYTDKAVDERLQGLVSTATFTPVKEKANNSLQKPAGLTKTKLVGVGTNGQENIEIGDNLTLANGKLSATGGGVNGLQSDGKGNLTVGKNLGVDGKLTLKSLVSATNPDGDITKELGGGGGDEKLYCHCLDFQNPSSDKGGRIILNYYSKKKDAFKYDTFKNEFSGDKHVACNGFIEDGSKKFRTPFYIKIAPRGTHEDLFVLYFNPDKFIYDYSPLYLFTVIDSVSEVI